MKLKKRILHSNLLWYIINKWFWFVHPRWACRALNSFYWVCWLQRKKKKNLFIEICLKNLISLNRWILFSLLCIRYELKKSSKSASQVFWLVCLSFIQHWFGGIPFHFSSVPLYFCFQHFSVSVNIVCLCINICSWCAVINYLFIFEFFSWIFFYLNNAQHAVNW